MEDIEINSNNEDHGVCVKEKMDALSFSENGDLIDSEGYD
jgi:hypothetical protein